MTKPFTIVSVAKGMLAGTIEYATAEKQSERLKVCGGCERLNTVLNVCKSCGCFVKHKVKFEESSCPEGKW